MDRNNNNRPQNGQRAPNGRPVNQGRPGAAPGRTSANPQVAPRRPQQPGRPQARPQDVAYRAKTAEAQRRREAERIKAKRERARKAARERAIIRGVFLFAVILLVAVALISVIMWAQFNSTPDAEPEKPVVYNYGGESNSHRTDYELAFPQGKLYVNYSKVAEYLDMTVVGDTEKMRFVIPDDNADSGSAGSGKEEYAWFTVGTNKVEVNGQPLQMAGKSILRESELWIPAEFISECMKGVTLTYDSDERTVTVARDVSPDSSDENIIYQKLAFKHKPVGPMDTVTGGGNDPGENVTFTADLSAYEKYMNPENNEEYLILANKTTMLDSTYMPGDLTDLADTRKDGRDTQQMRLYAAKALEALYIEMRALEMTDYNANSGQVVSVTSGYRSYGYQEYLFNLYIQQEMDANPALSKADAQAIVETYSAKPGTSEHQTGLCVDMHNLPAANQAYANEKSYKWLCDNAWKFGFILRYPSDKVATTGYDYEPWHWRFVGREAAYEIYTMGYCLEEYLASRASK